MTDDEVVRDIKAMLEEHRQRASECRQNGSPDSLELAAVCDEVVAIGEDWLARRMEAKKL
jgi:hypothetical protein